MRGEDNGSRPTGFTQDNVAVATAASLAGSNEAGKRKGKGLR